MPVLDQALVRSASDYRVRSSSTGQPLGAFTLDLSGARGQPTVDVELLRFHPIITERRVLIRAADAQRVLPAASDFGPEQLPPPGNVSGPDGDAFLAADVCAVHAGTVAAVRSNANAFCERLHPSVANGLLAAAIIMLAIAGRTAKRTQLATAGAL